MIGRIDMEVIISDTAEEASLAAARLVARTIRKKPSAVLGLATGGTPLLLYQELRRLHREDGLDFSGISSFNLDEYIGLSGDHPCSYRHFMDTHLFKHVNMESARTHIPDGTTQDVLATCMAYEEAIVGAGGIDLQILGIGGDGHIGFNEPTSSLASRTRIKTLTAETRQDNARFFASESEIPRHVITMGVGTIMEAKEIILLAFGENKAQAVARTVEGPLTAAVPASILQMHREARVFVDEAAASRLRRASYYKEVFRGKPDWQCY